LLAGSRNGIAYGGDYNPDQWPEEVWDDDIRLMKQARVNFVSLAIFSWSKIEPREGEWDFDWLDRIITKLGEAGIGVDLGSATATAPMWLYERYPQILPIERDGTVVNPGSRQSWRPTSAVFRRYALEVCRRLAERYGDNPYVIAWHVGNEYGWNNLMDYSEDAHEAFKQWCEAKYRTIDEVNSAWGTSFWSQTLNDFDEILLPVHVGDDSMVNPCQWLDFKRFCSDMLKDFYCAERDEIAKICPDKPITTNFMVSTDQAAMDYDSWSREVDFVSNDHYFTPGRLHLDELMCSDSLVNGFAHGHPWWLMESSTSAVNWRELNPRKRWGELTRDSLAHVAMGADAVGFFQWRQSDFGAEAFHSAMVPHAGEDSRVFREVCDLGEVLRELSGAGLAGTRVERAQVALLFDIDSQWESESPSLPTGRFDHWHDIRDWHRAFLDAGINADVVPLKSDWGSYRLVVLPTVLVMSDEDCRRVERYVHSGGAAIVGPVTDILDERVHIGLGGYPAGLSAVTGTRSEEFNFLGSVDGDPSSIELSNGFRAGLIANVVTSVADSVEVLASYSGKAACDWELENVPAITRNAVGNGFAYYIGCDMSQDDIYRFILTEVLKNCELTTLGEFGEGHCNISHCARLGKDARFDFYFNRSKEDVDISRLPLQGDIVLGFRCEEGDGLILERNGVIVTKGVAKRRESKETR
jgi:beta-galactosidase